MLPKELEQTMVNVHGEAAKVWLAALPHTLEKFCRLWSIKLDQPFENLSYNLVIPGTRHGGEPIVLKAGVPCSELTTETAALEMFAGSSSVRLLEEDRAAGFLLLERLLPGTSLHEIGNEEESTRISAQLMKRLWREPPLDHGFPSLRTWFRSLDRIKKTDGKEFPMDLVTKASVVLDELLSAGGRPLILHGDLHHDNVLYSQKRGWLVIDPKGVCGDPAYEVGTFMLNQLPEADSDESMSRILGRRLVIFSEELDIDWLRLARWAFAHAVLSAVWSLEESADWKPAIRVAQLLKRLAGNVDNSMIG
ncbi:MAG TPA: aminoglycoside phosphotransferase family protein [Pyrinomonadaceae bacterium]|jgi:streptomycin 6-kinase|nr:aminoglycoside phosphotransferase family protein [Pyrinomonadaceae bacterium]